MQNLINMMKKERSKLLAEYKELEDKYCKLDDAIKCLEGPASTFAEKPPKEEKPKKAPRTVKNRGLTKDILKYLAGRKTPASVTTVWTAMQHVYPSVSKSSISASLSVMWSKNKVNRTRNAHNPSAYVYKAKQ